MKKSIYFRRVLLMFLISLGNYSVASVASVADSKSLYCGPETRFPEFCNRMLHLKATINTLDSQTWFENVNHSLLENLAVSLIDNTAALNSQLPEELKEHRAGLKHVQFLAKELKAQSASKQELAKETAGYMKYQCLSCHSSTHPIPGGLPWNDVFGFNWSETARSCERNHTDPYLCISMNAMATDYSHIDTAHNAGIQNYEVTSALAKEIMRVLEVLKSKGLEHIPDSYSESVRTEAQAIVELAAKKDPSTFSRARDLNQACMKCHMEAPAALTTFSQKIWTN